jgi:arginine-tRNA-protein transferase
MLVQYYYPFSLSPSRLDRYLAAGWFRNSIMLFRSKLLCMEGDLFNVVNIRLPLTNYALSKRYQKLVSKNKKLFDVRINRATINPDKERLYELHKPRFKGFIYSDLHQFLYSDTIGSVFQTYEIEIRDKSGKLVALSYFDKGQHSIASLIGIYDPTYSRYSLGTFTMLLEVEYALNLGYKFYYPGYIFDKPSVFDYKLKLGNFEYYDWRGKWKPYRDFQQAESCVGHLKHRLTALKDELVGNQLEHSEVLYPLFPLGYMDKTIDPFVKSPIFLRVHDTPFYKKEILFEYNSDEDRYSVNLVSRCPEYNHLLKMQKNYLQHCRSDSISVLKYVKKIAVSSSPEVVVNRYLSWIR